jgi:hypothetical protein
MIVFVSTEQRIPTLSKRFCIEKVEEEAARRGETECGGQYGSSEADKLCPKCV